MAQASHLPSRTDVLIIGAGPAGLLAALVCQARGLDHVIIDQNPPGRSVTRAMSLTAFSLEILRHLDLADNLLARGNPAPRLSASNRREVYAQVDVGEFLRDKTPFPYTTYIRQDDTERTLVEGYLKRGGQIRYPFAFEQLQRPGKDGGDWTIQLTDQNIAARYIIAADGMNSKVRSALGVGWSTDDLMGIESIFVDAHLSNVGDALDRSAFNGFYSPAGGLIFAPYLEANLYRLAAVMKDGVKEALDREQVQVLVDSRGPLDAKIKVEELVWSTRTRFHEQVTERFEIDRQAFLIGDAAHVHSPAGAQGINLAFGDAFLLCETLARILIDGARDDELVRWADKRKAVAERVVKFTHALTERMIKAAGSEQINPFAPPQPLSPGAPHPALVSQGLIDRPPGWDAWQKGMSATVASVVG